MPPYLKQIVRSCLLFRCYLDTKLGELFGGELFGSLHDRSLTAARHRECLHLAQVRLTREIHDEALHAQCNAAVRRYAEAECREHVPDALLYFFLAVPHYSVRGFEYLGLVRADATAARLVAVADQIVLRGENVTDAFFREELLHVLGYGHGEWVVRKSPSASRRFFEEWEFVYPCVGEDSLLFVFGRAQIKFVRAKLLHCFRIGEAGERFFFYREAHRFDRGRNHLFHRAHHIFLGDERHLDIHLRMLESAVGAEVFVAHRAGYLEVPLESADHEELLVLLGRLRKRVEFAWVQT